MEAILVFLATGVAAGLLAGLFGVGGGLVVVPALVFVLPSLGSAPEVVMQSAIGTSLAIIGLTGLSSTRAHHRRGNVLWPVVRQMTPGIVIGSLVGATVAHQLPGAWLKSVFAVGVVIIAVQMFLDRAPTPGRTPPGAAGLALVGAGIGAASALIGIGGGTLTVPFLIRGNVEMRRAAGTSAACGIPIAWAGAAGFAWNGQGVAGLAPWSLGYIDLAAFAGIAVTSVLFAPLGARLATGLAPRTLKRGFAIFLALIGLKLLVG